MRQLQILLAGLLLTFLSAPSMAASWRIMWGASTNSTAEFFDADAVEKDGDLITLWQKSVNAKNSPTDQELSKLIRLTISCKNKTYSISYFIRYDSSQKQIDSGQPKPDPQYIAPDTMGSQVYKVVCSPGFPTAKSKDLYDPIGVIKTDEMAKVWFSSFETNSAASK